MGIGALVLVLIAAVVGATALRERAPLAPALPADHPGNILIVLLDDVGVDKVSAYGVHPAAHTPVIDRLASRGMLFRNAYAYPSCSPSRAALLTGRYGRRTGFGSKVELSRREHSLAYRERTLPEVLKEAPVPYATAMVGKWHLTHRGISEFSREPKRHGFDAYAGNLGQIGSYTDWTRWVDGRSHPHWRAYATTQNVDDALERLGAMPEPWLLYLAIAAPHSPFEPPPPRLLDRPLAPDADEAETYNAMLEAADTEIGRLFQQMDDGVRARTHIFVMGDNGTPRQAIQRPTPRRQKKLAPWEGGSLVPLIVAGPAVASPGSESRALVHIVDILPTVAALAGLDPAGLRGDDGESVVLDGISFLPVLQDPTAQPRTFLYNERFYPPGPGPYAFDFRTLRDRRFKLIRQRGEPEVFLPLPGPGQPPWDDPDAALDTDALEPRQADAYRRLSDELDRLAAALTYDGG